MNNICRNISLKQLIEMLRSSDIIFLDVRDKDEYREKHLIGSKNIPIDNLREELERDILDKQKKVIVYCSTGERSPAACQILREMGYSKVYNICEGIISLL